jgi:hypothetical protein
MSTLEGVIGQIGKCNAKDIPTPNSSHTESDVCKSITKLVTEIQHIQDSLIHPHGQKRKKDYQIETALADTTNLSGPDIANIIAKIHHACTTAIDDTKYFNNIDDILRVKRLTKNMVISAQDKADSTLEVMCPIAYHRKIMKEMMECPNLTNITHTTDTKAIMKSIQTNYSKLRLSQRFPARKSGSIPSSYIKPKSKDPVKKNRVITSYYTFPYRRLLKLASKALTFCLRNLYKSHRHFTLHRLGDTKALLRKLKQKWHKQYGKDASLEVVATDLKQMYTHLNHSEIRAATLDLFDKIQASQSKPIHGRTLRKRKTLIKVDLASPYKAQFTTNNSVDSECVIFSLEDLYAIIDFDLNNTYTTIGNQIFKQNEGCPMGGLLSSFYGNNTCAFHENSFLANEPLAKNIWGIRQMDDLTLFIAHKKNDPNTAQDNARIRHHIQHNVYKGGLEAEIQDPDIDTERKYVHQFAGHEIHSFKNLSDIYTTTLNVNKISVHTTNTQEKVRYPNMHTYTNNHSKIGNIIGSIHRIRTQNTYRHDFSEAIGDLIAELKCINYSHTTIKKCVYKLARQAEWNTMLDTTIHGLARRPRQQKVGKKTFTTPPKP